MQPGDGDRRRSLRQDGHDYARPGWYFVTITTTEFAPQFGEIDDTHVILNVYGKIVADEWLRTVEVRSNVVLDAYVVMPDHLHGIVSITWPRSEHSQPGAHGSPSQSLSAIMRGFKGASTRRVNELRGTQGVTIWHRSFHDQVIRSRDHLDAIRCYIAENPRRWRDDPLRPHRQQ